MKKYILLVIVLIFVFMGSAFSQQLADGIVAIVGDNIVLFSDVNNLVLQYAFQKKIDVTRQPELYDQLGKKFLENLIDQKLLLIKADDDTIKADEDRVDAALKQQVDYLIQQAGSQEKLEEIYSAPIFKIKKDLRKEIENQMRISMLREKRFADVKISRKEVEKFYEAYKDSLPEMKASVDISHILMQVTPSKEAVKTALTKITEIQDKLKQGEDFAELARKYSEDPGSAENGGDLGFVSRGTLVTSFEEAAFALDPGEVSDIVQTEFGFHIIQTLEKQGERIHVRHILVRLQPTEADEQKVIDKLNDIRQKILSGDSTFQEMALRYSDDPNVQKDQGHLGDFEQGAFQIKEFEQAIQGLKVGEISQPFKTEFGYHIVQLNDRKESRTLSLKNDWEKIEQWALQIKKQKEFEDWLAKLRTEIPIEMRMEI
jgi:peptidyl-prolyl cis-trans isomerase SurA